MALSGIGYGRGGWRPGSGAKKQATIEAQQANRDLILKNVSPADVVAITTKAVEDAVKGDPVARAWVFSYIGPALKEAHLQVDVDLNETRVIVWPPGWTPSLPSVIEGEARLLDEPSTHEDRS